LTMKEVLFCVARLLVLLSLLAARLAHGGRPPLAYLEDCDDNTCFLLFPGAHDFAGARDACLAEGGILATLPSAAEARRVQELLLRAGIGRFWIGLTLAEGRCPTNDSANYGYEWVTEAAAGISSNWTGVPDRCDRKCVSVSTDGAWQQESCEGTLDGFLCSADACEPPEPRPHGTIFTHVDECQDAPCEHQCTNTRGSFTCSCFDGYRQDPGFPQRCQAYCGLAECPAECDPNDPEDCRCPMGYILDVRKEGGVCMDLDECNNYYCDQLCKNSYGNYTCSCLPGFSLVEGHECVLGTVTESFTLSYVPTSDPAPPKTARLSAGGLVAVVVAVAVVVFLAMILKAHCSQQENC
uniref:Thrombomodulin n=1 Tax=Gadus morhua TaxID=8049 RepID=A0A8C5FKA7_GADMO